MIRKVGDQLRSNEIFLLDVISEEREAVKKQEKTSDYY
jgi:hypothetical protein